MLPEKNNVLLGLEGLPICWHDISDGFSPSVVLPHCPGYNVFAEDLAMGTNICTTTRRPDVGELDFDELVEGRPRQHRANLHLLLVHTP